VTPVGALDGPARRCVGRGSAGPPFDERCETRRDSPRSIRLLCCAPEEGGGPDNARQFVRDPGGGWPLGRQAGPPGEYPPTPADTHCRNWSQRLQRCGQSQTVVTCRVPRAPGTFACRPVRHPSRASARHARQSTVRPVPLRAMRHPKFEESRFVGDKRTQLVYDLDEWEDEASSTRSSPPVSGYPSLPTPSRGPQPRLHPGEARHAPPQAQPSGLSAGSHLVGHSIRTPAGSPAMPGMDSSFDSDGLELRCHIGRPNGAVPPGPAVVLCHGFPIGPLDAQPVGGTYPQLMDRTAHELGLRRDDVQLPGVWRERRATSHSRDGSTTSATRSQHVLTLHEPTGVILVGTNTGGSIADLCRPPTIRGCRRRTAESRAPTSTTGPTIRDGSSSTPARSGRSTIVSSPLGRRVDSRVPPVPAGRVGARFAPRPLLVMHGDEDDSVPVSDARQLSPPTGSAELSLFERRRHRLRHDPGRSPSSSGGSTGCARRRSTRAPSCSAEFTFLRLTTRAVGRGERSEYASMARHVPGPPTGSRTPQAHRRRRHRHARRRRRARSLGSTPCGSHSCCASP
jgi:hypothetical protein